MKANTPRFKNSYNCYFIQNVPHKAYQIFGCYFMNTKCCIKYARISPLLTAPLRRVSVSTDTIFRQLSLTVISSKRLKLSQALNPSCVVEDRSF